MTEAALNHIEALKQVPLFSRMDDDELRGIRAIMDVATHAPGATLMREGEVGDHFFVVVEGTVRFHVENAEGRDLVVDEVGAGGFFGELSMLTGEPRSARVTAADRVTTLALDRKEFFEFLMKNPPAAIDVLTVLGQRLRRVDSLLRQSISRNVNVVDERRMTFGERISDAFATLMGSWKFIIVQSILLILWVVMNVVHRWVEPWDPYPFILLNLALSFQAAYAAPIIMMSQNRQADKDRLAAEIDHQVNTKAEIEIGLVMGRLDDLERALKHQHEEQLSLLQNVKATP